MVVDDNEVVGSVQRPPIAIGCFHGGLQVPYSVDEELVGELVRILIFDRSAPSWGR